MCFRCTKTSGRGVSPGPPHATRVPCQPARRCPGSTDCPEKGAERRGRATCQVAHTGHPATASRWAIEGAPNRFRGSIIHREGVEFLCRKSETGGTPTPPGVEFVR